MPLRRTTESGSRERRAPRRLPALALALSAVLVLPASPSAALDAEPTTVTLAAADGYPLQTDARHEAGNTGTFGILQLTLHTTSCDWRFLPVAGGSYSDSGSGSCH